MAIPSGKYFQTIDGVKTDLADICECDLAARGLLKTKTKYLADSTALTYCPYYESSGATHIITDFNSIDFPKVGSFPSIFSPDSDEYQTNKILYKIYKGNDSGTVTHTFLYDSEGWKCDGAVIFSKNEYYKGVVSSNIVIVLQGAGGGGGNPYLSGSSTLGGGGGGAGAAVWTLFNKNAFQLRLGPAGSIGGDGGQAGIYDISSSSNNHIAALGGAGGVSQSSGTASGGKTSVYGWSIMYGGSKDGCVGGKPGAKYQGGATRAGDGESVSNQSIYLYNDTRFGYSLSYTGGAGTGGGGGGASMFSAGSNGGGAIQLHPGTSTVQNYNNPTQPDYGAGGGGAYYDTRSSGGIGGKAYAVIYFGYSKDA